VIDGGSAAQSALDDAAEARGDADSTGDNPASDDADTTSSDASSKARRDAAVTVKPDGASTPPKDAAADVSMFTCSSCAQTMCPTQLAACGTGSDCLAYRDCTVACSIKGSSNCSNTCGTMYPSGQTAFAALTVCDLGCGAGCAAGLAAGTP
jgi:hypothetical protein